MASVLVRDCAAASRLYSQIRFPFVASSAQTVAPGSAMYITPRYTIGIPSIVPAGIGLLHAVVNRETLPRSICVSGLNRCASYVRLYISQSSGLGLTSISVVTGTNFRSCAVREIDARSSAVANRCERMDDVP